MSTSDPVTELELLRAKVTTLEQMLADFERAVDVEPAPSSRAVERSPERVTIFTSADGIRGATKHRRTDEALKALACGTSQVTGEQFLREFVRELAHTCSVRNVFVGEFVPGNPLTLHVTAHWQDTGWGPAFDYHLAQSPTEVAIRTGEASYPVNVRAIFPGDRHAAALDAESYLGVAIRSSAGDPLGVVFILDAAPLQQATSCMALLKIFAGRAGAELERMQTERALRESQERYARATAAGKVGVWELDVERGVYHSDPNLKSLLGYAGDELGTDPLDWLHHVHPDDQGIAADQWFRVAAGQTERYHCELRMRQKTGAVIWTEVRGHAIQDETGRLQTLLGTTVDITERKLAEEGLRESEERYRLIFETTPDPLIIVGFGHVIRDANPAACRAYGYERQDLLGMPASTLVHADSQPQWIRALEELDTGQSFSMLSVNVRLDGTAFPVEVHFSPSKYRGEPVILSSVRDITERHSAETVLREREERVRKRERDLRLVLDTLPVGVWLTNAQGRVILSNPMARRIWCGVAEGQTEAEWQQRWEDWINRFEPHRSALERALATGEASLDDTMIIECLDGTPKRIRHSAVPVREETGAIMGAIVVNEDVTERTLLEEQAHLFRTLMDHSSDAVFMCDPCTGRFLDVNAAACRHLDYQREELLRLGVSDIEARLPDRNTWGAIMGELRHTGSRTVTGWHRRKNGSIFPVEVNAGFVTLGRGDFIVAVARDISDRERAEEQLRHSEERFRTLIEYSSDIITVLNPDATIRYESPAFYRLFGYCEDDVLGKNGFDFVHPDDLQRTMQIFRERLYTPGLAEPVIFGFRKADGGYLTLEVVGNNLLHDPTVQGIVVNCREVTGRIRAEEALRVSEAKLRTLADHAPVSIFMSDPTGHCLYVNQRWCDMTGFPATEAYGQGWLRTLPPDEPDPFNSHGLGGQPAAAPTLDRESRYITRSGSIRWAEGSIVPLRNAQHEVTGFISTSTDITERRRAEEELRKSHAFIRHIIDTDPNLIFAKDREGRFTLVNKAAADFYGTTVDNLIGKTDADFNANVEVAAIRQQDVDVMDTLTERFISEEIITDAAGNRRWLQTVKRPLMDENARASQVLGASTDITARKKVEEALRQREQDLQAALAERERISEELHDGLLQSLYAVGLGLETCKSLMKRNSKRAAHTLERAVSQLNAVMREVRNFIAGLESELLQGGDLSRALRTVVESLASPQGLPFRVAIDEQAMRHITREQSLHVLNVVREAVSNSLRHAKASRGTVSLRRLKHVIRVTIRDNGIGFNPKAAIGLGHGLINMGARAKRVGGRLIIDSKPKQGTRIAFDLPKEIQHGRS